MLHSFLLFFFLFAFGDRVLLKIGLYDPADEDEAVDPMLSERHDYHKSLEAETPQSTPANSLLVIDGANMKHTLQMMTTSVTDISFVKTVDNSNMDVSMGDDDE